MKSKLNDFAGGVLLLSALTLPAAAVAGFALASAKADPPPSDERQRPGNNEKLPQMAKHPENQDRSVVKCWQYGRLILDERNWAPGYSNQTGVTFRAEGHFRDMRMMQFGDTFCVFKQSDTP